MDINTHSTLKTNLVAYWTLDANMNDSSGNGKNGTLYGSPTFPVAKLRTGVNLDGSTQRGEALNTGFTFQNDYSVAFWMKIDTWANGKHVFGAGGDWNQPQAFHINTVVDSGNKLQVRIHPVVGQITLTTSTTFSTATWYHIAFKRSRSGGNSYYTMKINGVVDSNINASAWGDGNYADSNQQVNFGYFAAPVWGETWGYLDGIVDEIGIWHKAISDSEITDLYQGGIGITWDGTFTSIKTHPTLRCDLLAHYKLDSDGSDSTGTFNGTLEGSPVFQSGRIGSAIKLNGSSQDVDLGTSDLLTPTCNMSAFAWYYPTTAAANYGIVSRSTNYTSTCMWYLLATSSSVYSVWLTNSSGTYVNPQGGAVNLNAWNFVGFTYDNANVKLYQNGSYITQVGLSGNQRNTTGHRALIGATMSSGPSDRAFYNPNKIDEVGIWGRNLAASEISDLYNSGTGLYYETGTPASGTFTSAQSGPWSDPATWGSLFYPGDGSTVTISAGHTVTIDGSHTCGTAPTDDTTMVLTINNTGWLKWTDNPSSSWTFTIKGNVNIVKGGKFSVGTASVPIPAAQTATVYFPSVNTTGWKIQANGTLEAYGAEAYHMASASMQRSKLVWNMTTGTGVSLKVADAVDWQVGDTVSISNQENPANLETLVIQSKIDAYTYTVNTSYVHLIDDFAVLVNRNVKFLGYDNAGRGVTIYVYHTSAVNASGSVINLSWCSFKYFGRATSTTLGTQALYYQIVASSPAGASLPDANFKLVGVVFDELSNSNPDGTVYLNSDIAFNGTSYRLDGVHFTGAMTRKCVYISIDGVTKLRGVTATYVQAGTGNYGIFGRWGDLYVDSLYFCGGASSTPGVWGYARLVSNCHFCGGAFGIYYYHISSGGDNYAYMMVNEACVDSCKFISMTLGVSVAQNGSNCYGMTYSVYIKNCEFFGCGSNAVLTYGQSGRIRVENCTVDGVGSYSSTNTHPFSIASSATGSNTDAVIAGCTIGRTARMPNAIVYYDGLNPSNKISVVGCEIYQPWYTSAYEYQDWLYYTLFRFASSHTSYEQRWRTNPSAPASATGCKLWLGDGSGRNELFSMLQRYRRIVAGAGSEVRDQLSNIDTGKFPLRLVPFSPCIDADSIKRTPIKINASPNKRITATLKFKNVGTSLRTRAGMRLYGGGIFSKARMTAAAGEWQTLTVLGDCNPSVTARGAKYMSGLVGYWTLNQTMNDSHTNALHGTCPTGTMSYTTCKYGYGMDTGGSVLTVKLSSGALVNPANFTICAWLYVGTVTGVPERAVVAKDCDELASLRSYSFGVANGYWYAGVATAGGWDSVTGPAAATDSAGTYRFAAMSFDGTTIRLCFNGMVYSKTHAYPGNAQVNSTVPLRFASKSRRGWAEKTYSTKPSGRWGNRMVFDSARGVCVMFGGSTSGGANDETWEYDGSSWTQRSPGTSPPARYDHAMAFDPVRNVTVLHGGTSTGSNYLTDTWEYNGTTWTQKSPTTVPSGRYYHGMVYDANIAKVLMYGGIVSGGRSSQTYTWNGTDWTLLSPANNPGARSQFGLAFDATRNVTVFYCGYNGSAYSSGTWEFNGTDWVDKSITIGQYDAPLSCFYPPKNVVLSFGGVLVGVGLSRNTVWYDGNSWRHLTLENPPVGRQNGAIAYDSVRGKVVIFGGQASPPYPTDTWEYPEAVDGYSTGTECWNGSIDEVSLFNRALTPAELTGMYNQGRGLLYDEPSSYSDSMQVNLVLSAGVNNTDPRDRSLSYPGAGLYLASGGPGGMQDPPALKVAVDVDTLTITESSIP